MDSVERVQIPLVGVDPLVLANGPRYRKEAGGGFNF
jgi:hypothetical protein